MHTIYTVVGARPEFIKSGTVSKAFDQAGIAEALIHTGQHYDLNMSDVFFSSLGLREPKYHLNVGSGSHGKMTGEILAAMEEVLVTTPPDGVVVYGDTNSTLAGALAAAKLHIPVFHIEAGLRSFNRRMPEEINRIMTDHISDLLFCPTEVAVNHLSSEGITSGVHLVGDVMQDGVDLWSKSDLESASDGEIAPGKYYLATVHRQENVDSPARLDAIFAAFASLDYPVVLPLHPRTRKELENRNLIDSLSSNVRFIDPVGYTEMLSLLSGAKAMLTDSGGVQKEAYMMRTPCVTLRDETEWTETVDSGWNVLAGADTEKIVAGAMRNVAQLPHSELYGDGHASERIVQIVGEFLDRR